jgi:hypothetical protein
MKEDNKLIRVNKTGYKPIVQPEPEKHVYPEWAFDPDIMEVWLGPVVKTKRKYKKK